MRRLAPILALCLVAACGRDFSLPPAPAVEPEFLGPLAGFYVVRAPLPALAGTPSAHDVDVPLGTVLVLQDLVAPDGGPDPVAGVLVDVEHPPLLAPKQSVRATAPVVATYQDRKLEGSRTLDAGDAAVTGAPIAGGGGLTLAYATCPGETLPPVALHALLTCDYEPQISGVYAGHAGSCDAPASGSAAWMGLGIRDLKAGTPALALGLGYPDSGEVFAGSYDRFSGCGNGLVFDLGQRSVEAASFTLVDDGHDLTLDLNEGPVDQALPADLCQPASHTCTTRLTGTRHSGTEPDRCEPPTVTGLTLAWSETGAGTARALDVRVHVVGAGDVGKGTHLLGRLTDDRALLQGALTPASGGAPIAPGDVSSAPDDVALRFPLPPVRQSPGAYRLQVWAAAPPGALAVPFAAAMPACVTDPVTP